MLLSIDADITPSVRFIGHIAYKEPWTHFTRTINEHILYVIKNGEMYIQEGEQKFELKKGEALLLQPNIMHTGFRASCCDYYYVHFKHPKIVKAGDQCSDEILQEMLKKRKLSLASDFFQEEPPTDTIAYLPQHHRLINETEILYLLKEAVDDYYNRYENYKKSTSCKFLDILIRMCRDYTSYEIEHHQTNFSKSFIKVRNILKYIDTEYHRKITSSDIEEMFESNFDYLNRAFHKMSGYTIFNYLNTVRINKAKELIETTPIKFSEVGYLVGIDDPYYFSKLFKKYTGITPTQYWKKRQSD